MFAIGNKHPMEASQSNAGLRCRGSQSCATVYRLEDDTGDAVANRRLEFIADFYDKVVREKRLHSEAAMGPGEIDLPEA